MEQWETTLIQTEERSRRNEGRIKALEADNKALQKLVTSVEVLAQNIKTMAEELSDQGKRLEALEKQPAERWNNMTRTIFTSVISTLAGGLVGALVALFVR